MPRSNGDFRIGAETFSKKLEYDEMVDLPLDKLLEIGWADLRKNQAHFKQVAKELEPDKDAGAVLEELGENHPAPDQLLNAFRATFDGLDRLYSRAPHRDHPFGCAAHRGRDSALHARHDLCLDGHAGRV